MTLGVELITTATSLYRIGIGILGDLSKGWRRPHACRGRGHRPPCRSSEGEILGASLEGGPSEGSGGRLAELVELAL